MTEIPQRFVHRTEEVEAVQWTGTNADRLRAFCGPDFDTIEPEDRTEDPDETAAVRTHPHGGWLGLTPGDWVLKVGEGRFTARRDAEFRAAWEPAAVPSPDQTALRERIAEALAPYFANFSDWETARVNGGEAAAAVLAVLPPPADRAAVLREAADRYAQLVDENEAYDREHGQLGETARVQHGAVRDVVVGLRRLAAEAQQPDTAHSCSNCEGIDPDTCLMNPNRPPEQCPRSEFDGYGLQCQKPAGHNLCTFEEQPPPAHIGVAADDCPACQAQGLHTIGHPYECPGSETRP